MCEPDWSTLFDGRTLVVTNDNAVNLGSTLRRRGRMSRSRFLKQNLVLCEHTQCIGKSSRSMRPTKRANRYLTCISVPSKRALWASKLAATSVKCIRKSFVGACLFRSSKATISGHVHREEKQTPTHQSTAVD